MREKKWNGKAAKLQNIGRSGLLEDGKVREAPHLGAHEIAISN